MYYKEITMKTRNLWGTIFYYYIAISLTYILFYIGISILDQLWNGKEIDDIDGNDIQEGMKKMKFPTPKQISKEISKNVGKPIEKGISKASKETKKGIDKATKETAKGFKKISGPIMDIFKKIGCIFNKIGNTTCWKFYFLALLGHILYIPFYIAGGISKTVQNVLDSIWKVINKIDKYVAKYTGGYHLVKFPDDIRKKCFKC